MSKIIPFPGLVPIGQILSIHDQDVECEEGSSNETLWSKTLDAAVREAEQVEKEIRNIGRLR